jgi:V/A-type H+-transporting ATPase subunit E
MALDEILKALEEEGDREVAEIIAKARAQADKIIEEAKEEAKRLKNEEVDKAKRAAESESARIINAARLFAKKEIIRAKEECIKKVVEEARERLKNLRRGKEYPQILQRLIAEAMEGVDGRVVVKVNPEDKELAQKLLSDFQITYELKPESNIEGGLQVQTKDASIFINNTLESRLNKAAQLLKTEVTKILFG